MKQTTTGRHLARLIALVVGLAICLVLFFWERPSLTAQSHTPETATRTAPDRPRSAPAESSQNEPAHGASTASSKPISPAEEALRATLEYSGDGWVRCALPEGLPELHLNKVPLASLQDGFLSMATETTDGSLVLTQDMPIPEKPRWSGQDEDWADYRAASEDFREEVADWMENFKRPVAFIQWDGAESGERGHCTVDTRRRQIKMKVWVKDKDGQPVMDTMVHSSHSMEEVPTNEQGMAVVSAWDQMDTAIYTLERQSETKRDRASITVTATDGKQITLVLSDQDPLFGEGRTLDRAIQVENTIAWFREALNRPGLSEGAKEQLHNWIERYTKSHAYWVDALDKLDDAKAAVEELEAQ